MSGEKWYKTMSTVVAICKATSMVDNIHTSVSFRTTQESGNISFPYVVIAYDSRYDGIHKIQKMFPFLYPNGFTPEGLAYDATMKLFTEISPDETGRYLFNLSDGEPFFVYDNKTIYEKEVAVEHTKSKIDFIRKQGVKILSYFISYDSRDDVYNSFSETKLEQNFKRMYGKSAKFISVSRLEELAVTINKLFLEKSA
jgi:nitric oxide reductase activation protein